jgi:circadian clock protein KaiC
MPDQVTTLDRMSTGVPALDVILNGGIPRYATVFVAGRPGTGKTVLCQQSVFANGRRAVPALYLSTLTESALKMMRHAETFRFFAPDLLGKEIIYSDVGGPLASGGPEGVFNAIDGLVKQHRPEFLVIDSFKVIREYFDDPAQYRRFLSQLVLKLATWEVTSFLVGEYSENDIQTEPDFAIADGILYLYGTEEPTRQKRFLRVMKMRGTDFFAGQHLFEIDSDGIQLYPRMDPRVIEGYTAPEGRATSAIAGLTEMMGGGIESSTSSVIVGSSGAGKSITALSFLVAGAAAGKPGLFVTFEERPDQLIRNAEQLGWDLTTLIAQELLDILYVSPSELDIDKHAAVIKKRAEAIHAETVVIDTISAIEASLQGEPKAHDYLWAVTDYFKRSGVTVVMTYEAQNHSDWGLLGSSQLSFIADSIVNLGLSQANGYLHRTISIPKMRGTKHDKAIREWFIETSDIHVGGVYANGANP